MTPLAKAIERHRAAQAAIDAFADTEDGYPEHLGEAEFDAIDGLAETPCANDAEFIEKLRYLNAYETRILGRRLVNMNLVQSFSRSIVTSSRRTNDAAPSLSHLEASRDVLGVLRRLRAGSLSWPEGW